MKNRSSNKGGARAAGGTDRKGGGGRKSGAGLRKAAGGEKPHGRAKGTGKKAPRPARRETGEEPRDSSSAPKSAPKGRRAQRETRPPGAPKKVHRARDRAKEGAPPRGPDQRGAKPGQLWIYGRHAVAAALRNRKREIRRLLVTASGAEWLSAARVPEERLRSLSIVRNEEIDAVLHEGAVHQGLAVMVGDLERARLKETCAPADPARPVVVLDQITDPQNIGAIFRSAAAFGARAVIVQDRRTPPRAGALAKAAAGAVEIVPCIEVVNISRAIEALKGLGYHCAGLAGGGGEPVAAIPAGAPVALVLGAEGAGLRSLVAQTCDALYKIPIDHAVESLNVSTAAAISLYAVAHRQG